MRKSIWTLLSVALVALLALACGKEYDDSAITAKVNSLEQRIQSLEEKVNQDVTSIQNVIKALQAKLSVSSVKPTENGYVISFSDGSTAEILNGAAGKEASAPVVGIAQQTIGGKQVYVWTINGVVAQDASGNPYPVVGLPGETGAQGVTPHFKFEEYTWYVSYDYVDAEHPGTWISLGNVDYPQTDVQVDTTDPDKVILTINGTQIIIPKLGAFYLELSGETVGQTLAPGHPLEFAYSVVGADAADQVTVDILSVTAGIEASAVPTDAVSGKIVLSATSDFESGKVVVFADNNKGKTSFKAISVVGGLIESVADVDAQVPAAGGKISLSVTYNVDYKVTVEEAAQGWISVEPDTKAIQTDDLVINVQANTTGAYRAGSIYIANAISDEVITTLTVVQIPSADVATDIASISKLAADAPVAIVGATVVAASQTSAIVTDGSTYIWVEAGGMSAGSVVNVSGIKKTDASSLDYVANASFAVNSSISPVEVDYKKAFTYFRYADSKYFFTTFNGTISKTEAGEYIANTYFSSFKMVIETPADAMNIESFVGKTVLFKGWVKAMIPESPIATYTFDAIVTEIEAFTLAEESGWQLTYNGYSESSKKESVSVAADAALAESSYLLFTYTDAQLEGITTQEELLSLISDDVLSGVDNIQYQITRYSTSYDWDTVYGAYTQKGSQELSFDQFPYGNNKIVLAGVDPYARFSGKYVILDASKPDPAVDAAYGDFIGSWSVPNNTGGNSVWKITADVVGSTYTISGINDVEVLSAGSVPASVKANFKDGKLVIPVQTIGEPFTYDGYNCQYYLTGLLTSGYLTYDTDSKLAVLAKMPDGSLEVRAGSSNGVAFNSIYYFRRDMDSATGSAWYGASVNTPIPATATTVAYIPAYEDYLGVWEVDRNDDNDIIDNWLVVPDVVGSSYIITGIGGNAYKVAAHYTASSGTMSIPTQSDLQHMNHSTYGHMTYGVRGYYVKAGATSRTGVTGTYDIVSFSLTGEGSGTLLATTPTLAISGGAEAKMLGLQWYAKQVDATGVLSYTNYTYLSDKTVVLKATDQTAYAQWLGQWTVGEETWTVSQQLAGYAYTVTGVRGTTYPFTALYDAASNSFQLYEQEGVQKLEVNYGTAEAPNYVESAVALSGNFTYNSTNYRNSLGALVATAQLESGAATLTPCNVSATYGDFNGFTLYVVSSADGKYYGWTSKFALPASISAASASAPAVNAAPRAFMPLVSERGMDPVSESSSSVELSGKAPYTAVPMAF